ncbi:MAG: M56 family metallopeptidase [Oscillospiraceae bacterium]|nr:M56 family metallopeptidase [Oscillospiraceae bacterium]
MENIWMVLQQTAAATLTALFLLILQRIFLDKLSPRWQYGVWLVLLLRLLVPAGFGGRPTVLDVTFWVETLRTRVELGLNSAYSTPFAASLPAAPVPLPPAGAPTSWTDWAFLIYCAGVVLWAAWFVAGAARLSLRVRGGVPVEGERRAAIEALAREQRLPMPRRIVECRWARTPFVVGVVRPALVLPMGWALDGKVVLHELLHLKYRDVWAGWLTTALRCLHWCNPFLWFVFDKTGNDRESLCDQRVLERLEGEERRDYGRCLLAMADDRAMRTPGATTMANGARAVKARIEAIARFKRFPQGMGLVSGCIVFALSLSLVAGVPVPAEGEETTVRASQEIEMAPELVAETLVLASQNRATTVAGALDAYGKGEYHRFYDGIYDELLCWTICAPQEDLPAVLERWEQDRGRAAYGWRTGPVFRGLTSDGGDGYLCQVFWFRDMRFKSDDDPRWPEEDEPWPVEYLCHTVRVRPDGDYWTVEKLAETSAVLEEGWYSEHQLYGPVTWSGEAEGISVELSHTTTTTTGAGPLRLASLRDYQEENGLQDILYPSAPDPEAPLPDSTFSSVWSSILLCMENQGDTTRYPLQIHVQPVWDDPEIQVGGSVLSGGFSWGSSTKAFRSEAAFTYEGVFSLEPGEVIQNQCDGGGAEGALSDDMRHFVGPDGYQVTLTLDLEKSVAIPLTPRYTTPDGGTFTLDGEEGPQ